MLDDKTKLEQYFKEEIDRVSGIEIKRVEDEIADIREKALQGLEADAQREAGIVREQELKELQSEHAIRLSKAHEETNRKLMAKRKELSDLVFQSAKDEIKAFTKKDEYRDYLKKKASALAKRSYTEAVFFVGKEDASLQDDIKEAYGKECEVQVDADIILGGLRLECAGLGIVIDETFDTALEEQKDWFYTNSGLFIK